MRWDKKIIKEPKRNETKQEVKFAWFPIEIYDKIVWLERYIQIYRYGQVTHFGTGMVYLEWSKWGREFFKKKGPGNDEKSI